MEINVHGKHNKVPKALSDFATQKMQHLGKFLSTITTVDVELYEDGRSHVAHVTVSTPGPVFRSKVTSAEPHAGIDTAMNRLERQIKEFKRKRSGKPPHAKAKAPLLERSLAVTEPESEE